MDPYYRDDLVTLYLGDCRTITPWLAGDVLITDPPYGIGYQSHFRRVTAKERIAEDQSTAARDAALAMWGDRPAAVFGTWKQPPPTHRTGTLVWDKSDGTGPGMGDLTLAFGTSHEDIYLLGRWPLQPGRRRLATVLRTTAGMATYTTRVGHPTPKPLGLMERIIDAAPPGVVVDPFAGSGSTLIAARNLGRRAVGVELVERFAELTAQRLAQGALLVS